MIRFIDIFIFIAVVVSMTTLPASANDKKRSGDKATDSPLSFVYVCAEEQDPVLRLACYDKNVAALRVAEQKQEIVAVDAVAAKKIKREAFGFNLPSLGKIGFPKIGGDKKLDSVILKVKSIRTKGYKHTITLENGQVWKEIGGHQKRLPKGDLTAIIKSKSLGSFMLNLSNGNYTSPAMRVRRVK